MKAFMKGKEEIMEEGEMRCPHKLLQVLIYIY